MKTWLITGASTGIGRGLAEEVLKNGDMAALTARDPHKMDDLKDRYGDRVLLVPLEVTSKESRKAAIEKTIQAFGRIDVLVNNAGRGQFGSVEESSEEDIRLVFETNFFGPVGLIRQALPYMRKERSGLIINISSMGVMFETGAGNAYYVSSKAALEMMSEVLNNEVKPLGIDVMIVEPGTFRTEFRKGAIDSNTPEIADYANTAEASRQYLKDHPYNQNGDPKKAGEAILKAGSLEEKPKVLILGDGMIEAAQKKLNDRSQEIAKWRTLSESTDYKD